MSTRDRILATAAAAFRRQGYNGTGLKQITAESDAPFGSLYHFFPGGKTELAAVALRWSGNGYQQLVESVWDAAPDPVTAVRDVFAAAAEVLELTDYADACPIATVALEVASTNDVLRTVTAEIFEDWIVSGVERLSTAGLREDEARRLATSFIAALEGGFLLSRAMKSTEPMHLIGRTTADSIEQALRPRRRPAPHRRRRPG